MSSQQVSLQVAGSSPGTVTFAQSFGYDAANRLNGVTESNGASAAWSESYAMDQYGNRAVTSSSLSMTIATPTNLNQFNAATNRISNQPDGSAMPLNAYDSAGNLTNHPRMGQFVYDAENRLLAATSVGASYAYDGLGGGYRRQPRQGPLTMFTTQTVSWRRNTVRSARQGERCS